MLLLLISALTVVVPALCMIPLLLMLPNIAAPVLVIVLVRTTVLTVISFTCALPVTLRVAVVV